MPARVEVRGNANDEPGSVLAVCCMGCCFCFGFLFLLAAFVLSIWLVVLQLNVGHFALKNDLSCDQPLGLFLLLNGVGAIGYIVIIVIFFCFVCCVALAANERNPDMANLELNLGTLVAIWLLFLLSIALFILAILGNVWVWSSNSCDDAKVPEPSSLMLGLYSSAKLVVIVQDVYFALMLCQMCIKCCIGAPQDNQYQQVQNQAPRGAPERVNVVNVVSPWGMLPVLRQASARHMNERRKATEGDDRIAPDDPVHV